MTGTGGGAAGGGRGEGAAGGGRGGRGGIVGAPPAAQGAVE